MDKTNGETTPEPQAEQTPTPEEPAPDQVSVECKHCHTQNEFEVKKDVADFTFKCAGCRSEITWTR